MKILKTIIFVLIIALIQLFLLESYNLKSEVLSNVITFLSIIFGFYITSLSIFVTSRYVSSLYKITDANDSSRTLLNTLIGNYRFGLITVLITIAYLLGLQIFMNQSDGNPHRLSDPFLIPFLGLIALNFWYSYKMLKDLISIILQEAKTKAN